MSPFKPKSFTLRSNGGLLNVLKTNCGVSSPFKPNSGKPHPVVKEYIGIWDTGATSTVITKKIAHELDLKPTGKSRVYHANGEDIVNTYYINLLLLNGVAFSTIKVTEGDLNGADVLIGMDIISRGDFSISNVNNNTVFSFRIPSIHEVDFTKEPTPKLIPATSDKTQRNDPCPCGSGKKYKNCCGKHN